MLNPCDESLLALDDSNRFIEKQSRYGRGAEKGRPGVMMQIFSTLAYLRTRDHILSLLLFRA